MTDPAYFERMYAEDPDPWRFASSDYERDKYAATLAALPPRRFTAGLEIGCSIGVLSHALAERCDTFLGIDVAESALHQARQRCQRQPQSSFARMLVPGEWPPGRFDLIVFSEVLYYFGDALPQAADKTVGSLLPGGLVVLVNWLGDTGTPVTGHAAAHAFIAKCGLPQIEARKTDRYRLDILQSS